MERNDWHHPIVNWGMDLTDLPSDFAIQQMREAESVGWKGGDNFFDGKHDEFCFVCGDTMELIPCQTCENCYHADCMSPQIEPDEVPGFWYCPYCVERELHIPPGSPTTHYFTPVSPAVQFISPSSRGSSMTQANSIVPQTPNPVRNNKKGPTDPSTLREQVKRTRSDISSDQNTKVQPPAQPAEAHSAATLPAKGVAGRPRKSYSPPRKKSKYSWFSHEVDKALAVIHKELEKSAQTTREEQGLQDRIQTLEQQLKLKDGQILLGLKELEFSKRKHGESSAFEAEINQLKEQNAELVSLVEKKDAELRDWRLKLKSMIGNDLE